MKTSRKFHAGRERVADGGHWLQDMINEYMYIVYTIVSYLNEYMYIESVKNGTTVKPLYSDTSIKRNIFYGDTLTVFSTI